MKTTLLLAAFACAAPLAHAADHRFNVGTGVEASSGKYGTSSTTRIVSVPLSAGYTRGKWSLKASVPWLRVDGDANVVPGLGSVPNSNPLGRGRTGIPILDGPQAPGTPAAAQRGRASGVGDLRLASTYTIGGDNAGVGLTANAKIATANQDKGLGTGANDYGAALDAYRNVGSTTLFGGVGYTRLGQSRYIDVESAANANAGVSVAAGRGRVGVQYDWREAVARTSEARRDATGFYSRPVGGASEVQVYASKGVGDGSPDWTAGVGFNVGF
ncbi:transporter [Lysobacter xanthus]